MLLILIIISFRFRFDLSNSISINLSAFPVQDLDTFFISDFPHIVGYGDSFQYLIGLLLEKHIGVLEFLIIILQELSEETHVTA